MLSGGNSLLCKQHFQKFYSTESVLTRINAGVFDLGLVTLPYLLSLVHVWPWHCQPQHATRALKVVWNHGSSPAVLMLVPLWPHPDLTVGALRKTRGFNAQPPTIPTMLYSISQSLVFPYSPTRAHSYSSLNNSQTEEINKAHECRLRLFSVWQR